MFTYHFDVGWTHLFVIYSSVTASGFYIYTSVHTVQARKAKKGDLRQKSKQSE